MSAIEIRQTSVEDVLEYVGEFPCYRARSWTAVQDGRIIGIGGFGYHPSGVAILFMHCDEGAQKAHRIRLCKLALMVLGAAKATGRKVIAQCDDTIDASERFLIWLGFRRVSGDLYELVEV